MFSYSCDHNSAAGFYILNRFTQTTEQEMNNVEVSRQLFKCRICTQVEKYQKTCIKLQVTSVEC